MILTYDVNKKRLSRILKISRKYLFHVQKSVFEGDLTERKLNQLKSEINRVIDPKEDAVCIYQMGTMKYTKKLQIGKIINNDFII